MKVYFFSALNGNKFAGPSYSVPRTILEVSKRETVVWINMLPNYNCPPDFNGKLSFISYEEYKRIGLKKIIKSFGTPDFAIFEEVLNVDFCFAARKLQKIKVPYMIVPRGCLCDDAQSRKALKKKIANLVLFNRFIKNASCIQYLTDREAVDSGEKWNKNYCIIPNGTDIPNIELKKEYSKPLKGVFIGRIDIFHKGLDLLVSACGEMREILEGKVIFDIYGADSVGDKDRLISMIKEKNLESMFNVLGPVYDEDKRKALLSHDFFVLTSRFEGHPMGLLEALSYGLPALVTSGCNMGEEIERGNCGWNSVTDTKGITISLKKLILDINELGELSANALELAKKYCWDNVINTLIAQIYKITINTENDD